MARAKKSLGQNFLVDPRIQTRIVDAIDPRPDDTVIEIGPGHGALTHHIAPRVHALIAIELDDDLARALQKEYHDNTAVTILHMDALEFEPASLGLDVASLKIIGNIPYNITSPLIFRFLERGRRPGQLVLMVQKEVATRIAAPPGSRDYGALSIGVQAVARVERLFTVARGSFRPAPNVDSTVLRITPIRPHPLSESDEFALRTFTRAAFQRRRKQLKTILRTAPEYQLSPDDLSRVADETDLDLSRRPETLSTVEVLRLVQALPSAEP